MNSRAVLWGGAAVVVALVVAALLVPFVYVAIALAVLLLVALVVANRLRVSADEEREADNDESTARLGSLGEADDYERYDASAFDSVLFRPESRTAPEPTSYEEYAEPEAEWTTGDFSSTPSFVDEQAPTADTETYETYETYETTYEYETYEVDDSSVAPASDPAVAFEEYTGPTRSDAFEREYEYDTSLLDEPVIDESIIDEVDASSVLADEGLIDETKVTSTQSILAASQASRFQPEQMTEEESNAETREILGRVAALLAKYE